MTDEELIEQVARALARDRYVKDANGNPLSDERRQAYEDAYWRDELRRAQTAVGAIRPIIERQNTEKVLREQWEWAQVNANRVVGDGLLNHALFQGIDLSEKGGE